MALKLPTPPTPPTIDKGEATESTPRIDVHQFFEIPIKRQNEEKPAPIEQPVETPPPVVERKVTTPEDMARESVANGGGALTKKTITRPETETPPPVNTPATANLPITNDNSNRGKEILREFQEEDRQILQITETPRSFNRHQNESYSGFYWVVMLVLVGILSIVFVRKFLVRKNPKLKKSELFEDSSAKLKTVSEKVSAPKINPADKVIPPIKKSPPKKDDDKGKHFEVRV